MAITNTIRAYNSLILLVDSDPSIAPGATAGVTSLAMDPDGVVYKKVGKLDTDWIAQVNPVNFPSSQYGSFYDTTTQTNLISSNLMTYDTTVFANNVSIVSGSQITFAKAGYYNIQFSVQVEKTGGSPAEIEVWLKQNGVDDLWSNTATYIQGNNQKFVLAWNFFVNMAAGQYAELAWHSVEPSMRLVSQVPGARPGIPSVILTVSKVP